MVSKMAAWAITRLRSLARLRDRSGQPTDFTVTPDDITYAYRLLFTRRPDPDGWHNYSAMVGKADTQELVGSLMSSEEFRRTPMYRAVSRQERTDLEAIDIGDDLKMFVSPHDILNRPLLESRKYEPHLARALDLVIRPAHTVYCIGANVGYHAIRAARRVGQHGRVVAMEASPQNAALLGLNVAVNDLANTVILPLVASDRARLFRYVAAQGTNGYIDETEADLLSAGTSGVGNIVQGVPLDVVARAWQPVNVLQLDVEGAEGLVLRGAHRLLTKHRPVVFSELCPGQLERTSRMTATEYLSSIVALGYTLSVLAFDGSVVEFGKDIDGLADHASRQLTSHIDIQCNPD